MAIKIECSKCGFQNELGRVFCSQCAQKLNLQATSMSDLDERRAFDFGKLARWLVATAVILALAGGIGLALWPLKPVPVLTDPAGLQQIPIKAKAIRAALSYNKPVSLDLQEGELNGFLAERAKSKHLRVLTIDLKPGSFNLYAAFNWFPATNVTFLAKISFPVTVSFQGSFIGGVLMPGKGWVGHLPLLGSTRDVATDYFASLFPDIIAETKVVDALRTIALEETRADLFLEPAGK
ncbi:MAG: zinc ribbon domain-containing protein [bacterium]